MRRSITAFICGLIGSLFSLFWGFVAGVVGNIGSIIGPSDGSVSTNVIYALGWIAFLGAILGIVGSSLCFKMAKKGGVMLFISMLTCSALQIYLFVQYAKSGNMITTGIFVFLLPVALFIASTISAFCAKEISSAEGGTVSHPKESAKINNGNALEEELINLKSMFEKGLITQEEYTTAKKSAIDKYMK